MEPSIKINKAERWPDVLVAGLVTSRVCCMGRMSSVSTSVSTSVSVSHLSRDLTLAQ